MAYVIGIDGGGTKTRGVLLSQSGRIAADRSVGPTNYQTIGAAQAEETLQALVAELISAAGDDPVTWIHYGLSGADLPCDFSVLNRIAESISKGIPFEVANDTWCVMRSALTQSWGAVSLYGTGANAAALGKDGQHAILRALGYTAGGIGGGDEIAMAALHYAFRADEGTYRSTLLETELPKLMGLSTMTELLDFVYPELTLSTEAFKRIPPLVFSLANAGDSVCIELLESFGKTQGELVAGMIVRAGLVGESVPVVLGGSVYNGTAPYFIDAMMAPIHQVAPTANILRPDLPPVAGAALLAADAAGFSMDNSFYQALHQQL